MRFEIRTKSGRPLVRANFENTRWRISMGYWVNEEPIDLEVAASGEAAPFIFINDQTVGDLHLNTYSFRMGQPIHFEPGMLKFKPR
jgi:hypothetical protein